MKFDSLSEKMDMVSIDIGRLPLRGPKYSEAQGARWTWEVLAPSVSSPLLKRFE